MPRPHAALLRSAICLTTAKPRPSPTLFFFPGLTSRAWHDPKEYSWIKELENNHAVIKEEYFSLKKVREMQQGVSDYKINDKEHQLHQGAWDWLSYVTQGKRQEEFAIHCPHTTEILERIPSFMTGLPFAYAFFSSLKPQSSIKAHSAPCNIRLRCHFPLIVPEGCGIRVGDEIRKWKEGKCIVFDDAFDHEVWHDGTRGERVVLLFDVWHPDLIQEERQSIIEMFDTAKEKGWLKDSSIGT